MLLATLRGLGVQWLCPSKGNKERSNSPQVASQNVIEGETLVTGVRVLTPPAMKIPAHDTSSMSLQMVVGHNVNIVRNRQVPKPYRMGPSIYQVRKKRATPIASASALQNKMTQEQRYTELRRHKQELLERSRIYFTETEPPQKKVDLPKLTNKQREILDSYVKQPKSKLLGEVYKIQIYVDELRRLCSGNWLNDSIIDVLLSSFTENKDRVFAFTTHFYSKLEQDGPKALRRWAIRKKLNVLQQDKIIIPVNRGNMHWCLAVVDNKAKTMTYYDSLMGPGGDKVLKNLESYILMEADRLEPQNSAKNRDMITSYKHFPEAKGPLQTNGSDCGVFVTQSAFLIANDEPLNYSQADLETVRENFAFTILQLATSM